jgi:hypothetical protein
MPGQASTATTTMKIIITTYRACLLAMSVQRADTAENGRAPLTSLFH